MGTGPRMGVEGGSTKCSAPLPGSHLWSPVPLLRENDGGGGGGTRLAIGSAKLRSSAAIYRRISEHLPYGARRSWEGARKYLIFLGGRYWDRTSGPCRVKAVLYR